MALTWLCNNEESSAISVFKCETLNNAFQMNLRFMVIILIVLMDTIRRQKHQTIEYDNKKFWLGFIFKKWHFVKVFKEAKIKNRYNQVPHLTQDVRRESDKTQ